MLHLNRSASYLQVLCWLIASRFAQIVARRSYDERSMTAERLPVITTTSHVRYAYLATKFTLKFIESLVNSVYFQIESFNSFASGKSSQVFLQRVSFLLKSV